MKSSLVLALVLALSTSDCLNAQDWGTVATISTTLGINANRFCIGEGLRVGDIGCPSYAPSLTTAGDVSVTGNLSANKFIGDGSSLTGLSYVGDRITSGTSSIILSQSGPISFTTAGTERMVINSAGNVGIGTSTPAASLEVTSNTLPTIRLTRSAFSSWDLSNNGSNFLIVEPGQATRLTVRQGGNVGVGTTAPNATLQVSGSFTVSTSAQTTSPSFQIGIDGTIGIGTMPDALMAAVHISKTMSNRPVLRLSSGIPGSTYGDILLVSNGASAISWAIGHVTNNNTFSIRDLTTAGTPHRFFIAANGNIGISTTIPNATLDVYGTVSATNFVGNGSGLTGISVSGDRIVSGSASLIANVGTGLSTSVPLEVSGALKIAGTGAETCDSSRHGMMQFNPVTGAPQICVSR